MSSGFALFGREGVLGSDTRGVYQASMYTPHGPKRAETYSALASNCQRVFLSVYELEFVLHSGRCIYSALVSVSPS